MKTCFHKKCGVFEACKKVKDFFDTLRERIYPFRIFRGALTQLRIRLLREPGIEGAEETIVASRNISAVLKFTPHSCRERIYPFRQAVEKLCCKRKIIEQQGSSRGSEAAAR